MQNVVWKIWILKYYFQNQLPPVVRNNLVKSPYCGRRARYRYTTSIAASVDEIGKVVGFPISPGSWVQITIEPDRSKFRLPVEIAQLTDTGYTAQLAGSLGSMRLLANPVESPRPVSEIGASAAPSAKRFAIIRSLSKLPASAATLAKDIRTLCKDLASTAVGVQVRDVGQASFVTILGDNERQLGHFDAGWPISFNGRAAPKLVPVADPAPVILSHWDWDHLHAWFYVPALRESCWVVPNQTVGPGATKLANSLHSRNLLKVYRGGTIALGGSQLVRCAGASGINDTGLALSLILRDGRTVLMCGDADYQNLPSLAAHDALVVTHHGAAFSGPVPLPIAPKQKAVISVGERNVYRHPSSDALKTYEKASWTLLRTARTHLYARGDRVLP